MSSLFKIEPFTMKRTRRVLNILDIELCQIYQEAIKLLRGCVEDPERIETTEPVLRTLAAYVKAIREIRSSLIPSYIHRVHERLDGWTRELIRDLESKTPNAVDSRRLLTKAMQVMIWAEGELLVLYDAELKNDGQEQPGEILIPSDLLYQCLHSLFPPERMLAVSGRPNGNQIELGAVFDITGIASAGHVRADPKKLGQALIAMSSTNTHLAAWFHSHPGNGLGSTCPSNIDLRQHQDWLQHYSACLLSGIFVQDRIVRFWGTGLMEGRFHVTIEGPGVLPLKGETNVYQILPG